jgi:hypothetical protein
VDVQVIRALSLQAQHAQGSNDAKADMLELEYLLRTAELRTQQAHAFEQLAAARQAEVNAYLQRQRDVIADRVSEQRPSIATTSSANEATPYIDAESIYYTDHEDRDGELEEASTMVHKTRLSQEVYDLSTTADLSSLLASAVNDLDPPAPTPVVVDPIPPPSRTPLHLQVRSLSLSAAEARRRRRSSIGGHDSEDSSLRKTKRIPVKRSIAGFALQRGAAKRLARNVHMREHVADEEEEPEVDENLACTFLGNCMCKECREERSV